MTEQQPTTPGVFISESAAVPHAVVPATTSVAAFPGVYPSGPDGKAVLVSSWGEFAGTYGDLDENSSLAALGIHQFFQNGGSSAYVVRLAGAAWSTDALKEALLTELGAGAAPAPTPALDRIAPAVFNLMCLPDVIWLSEDDQIEVLTAAHTFCEARRAFLIVDSPAPERTGESPLFNAAPSFTVPALENDADRAAFLQSAWKTQLFTTDMSCGAAYYPWVKLADPRPGGSVSMVLPPSGSVAGVYARTDEQRNVWKAPAGTEATLTGPVKLTDEIPEAVNDDLNVNGVNCLRTFPIYGTVVWGARTMAGADVNASDWKYVPVRRTALFIEQSLDQSLEWAVFEPNGPPLWAALRAEVAAFMDTLYVAGAFQGTSPASTYQVRCDATTTSPEDQLAGIANVMVSFQAVAPGEFLVLMIRVKTAVPD